MEGYIALPRKMMVNALNQLREDKLLKNEQAQLKQEESHKYSKTDITWQIDYKTFLNSTKFRVQKMFENAKKREQVNISYICSNCGAAYDVYSITNLTFANDNSICSACKTGNVVENEAAAKQAQDEQDLVQKSRSELAPLITLLSYLDFLVIPAKDVTKSTAIITLADYEKANGEQMARIKTQRDLGVSSNHAKSYFGGGSTAIQNQIRVEVVTDEKPKPPPMPVPTIPMEDIDGDNVDEDDDDSAFAHPPKPMNAPPLAAAAVAVKPEAVSLSDDTKPMPTKDDLYFLKRNAPSEDTFANVFTHGAAQKQASMLPSISIHSQASTPAAAKSVVLRELEDEELLRNYNQLMAKEVDEFMNEGGNGMDVSEDEESYDPQSSSEDNGEPIVTVQGVSKKLSDVSEEDTGNMTPEEYVTYFKLCQNQQ